MLISVRPVQVCLEQSIFIILAQIFKQSVRNKSAVIEHSESTKWEIREQSESTQRATRALKSESYSRNLKYVLFC